MPRTEMPWSPVGAGQRRSPSGSLWGRSLCGVELEWDVGGQQVPGPDGPLGGGNCFTRAGKGEPPSGLGHEDWEDGVG